MGCCLAKENKVSNDTKATNEMVKTGEEDLEPQLLDVKAGLSANMARISQDFSPINEENITPLDDYTGSDGYPLPKSNDRDPEILDMDMDDDKASLEQGHAWKLDIKFDANNNDIILNIADEVTNQKWTKRVTNNELSVDSEAMHAQYLKLQNFSDRGRAKYIPTSDAQCILTLSGDGEIYEFVAEPT